ncbi:hypothetical protein [Alteribacillus bidgolensis]|uniref:Uncharacterized protein n=1 Tax=Alteribacillus bidgolensis TaxID=930129 RepID=A0A1G8QNV8_9BACI|nr:hypothetical protein [Alteribacillus bidgolensis]SDJ06366.1 hypothetical protein SAMN05216352_12114 [Alteribacillus bidgolensis]
MSARKQTSEKGKEKIKDAFQSGNKRPSPAHAFFGTNVKDNSESETSTTTEKGKTEQEQENITGKRNSFSEQSKENITGKQKTELQDINGSDNRNSIMDKYEVSDKDNIKTEQENSLENSTKETENETGLGNSNLETKDTNDSVGSEQGFWGIIEQEKKKKKVEDTHQRDTFLIRKDLLREFNRMAKKQPKGFKTKAINYALENFLNEVKNNE